MALVDLFYPKTWYNVREEDDFKMTVAYPGIDDRVRVVDLPLKNGVYRSIDEVIETLRKEMDNVSITLKDKVSFKRFTKSGKMRFVPEEGVSVMLSEMLGTMFGFAGKVEIQNLTKSPFFPDVRSGMHNLFVYSDIVEPSLVGDTMAPLLRIIRAEPTEEDEEHGGLAHYTCQKPFYYPVAKSEFQMLEINIRDELGRNVAFAGGKVIATLHFREKKRTA